METFFIETESEEAYMLISDLLLKRSLSFFRNMKNMTLILKAKGTEEDYKFLEKELHILNRRKGYLIANIYREI